jgi:hypothetical protein
MLRRRNSRFSRSRLEPRSSNSLIGVRLRAIVRATEWPPCSL